MGVFSRFKPKEGPEPFTTLGSLSETELGIGVSETNQESLRPEGRGPFKFVSRLIKGTAADLKSLVSSRSSEHPAAAEHANTDLIRLAQGIEKPEAQKQVSKNILKKLKEVDYKSLALSAGAGAVVRIGAKIFLETTTFGTKTAVAGVAGGAAAGAREWWKQRKELNEQKNQLNAKLVETMSQADASQGQIEKEILRISDQFLALKNPLDKIMDEEMDTLLYLQKKRGNNQLFTIEDFNRLFPKNTEDVADWSTVENIRKEVEKLKIDKKKIAKAVLKGAVAGAIGSMVIGEVLEFGSSHNWFGLDEKAKDLLAYAQKGLFGAKSAASGVVPKAIILDRLSEPDVVKHYTEVVSQKLYQFSSPKLESLTMASRSLIHDYVANEQLVNHEKLSVEQMVYAEDYLKNTLEKAGFNPAKELNVPGKIIREAVERAKNLNQGEISNLSKMLKMPGHHISEQARNFMTNSQGAKYSSAANSVREFFGLKASAPTMLRSLAEAQ